MELIICKKCNKLKPHYTKGLCKSCYDAPYKRKWDKLHPESRTESRKRWAQKNREKIIQASRNWRKKHPSYFKIYYQQHRKSEKPYKPHTHHSPRGSGRGWKKHSCGYILIRALNHPFADKQGYVRRSRLVAEKYLNRYLTKKEVVHHINGDITDDRPENLYVFPSSQAHLKFHSLKNKPKISSNIL